MINLPFAVWSPGAWLHGIVLPLTSPFVPGGQGIINMSLFERLGGNLDDYRLVGTLAVITALAAFALYYARLKRAWVPLVALIFFWPTRSFASYLIDLVPAAILAATTVRSAPAIASLSLSRQRVLLRRLVVAVPAVAFLAALVVAISAPQPLELEILELHSTGQLRTIDGIELRVHNRSDRPLTPHFTVANGGYLTSFWYPLGEAEAAASIPAHSSSHMFLRAPNGQSMPSIDGGFVVEAFTAHPATVSASAAVPPTPRSLSLAPDAINHPVAVGKRLTLTVRLVDRLGNPLRQRGIQVALGQVVYGQRALVPGEASIDGKPEGQSPVTRRTNSHGEVSFTVVGREAQPEPVFFQAWIAPTGAAPNGFSNSLVVQFVDQN